LGNIPSSNFPINYTYFNDIEQHRDLFPISQYPDVRSFWNGKNPQQLKQNDWFAINQGGHITILCSGLQLTDSNWLYVKFNSYDASNISIHTFIWYANESVYTEWYNSFTGSWLANGDPPE
jgi:hypothetical protein